MKKLPLSVLAVGAFVAYALLLSASTASATTLTGAGGLTLATGTEIGAESEGTVTLHPPIGDIECDFSEIWGTTTNAGGEGSAVNGSIEDLWFEACNAEVTVLKSGTFSIEGAGSNNGILKTTGSELTVTFAGFHCIFKTSGTKLGAITGSATTGSTATLDLAATIPRTGGRSGAFCGTTAQWTGSYAIESPDTLNVVGSGGGGGIVEEPPPGGGGGGGTEGGGGTGGGPGGGEETARDPILFVHGWGSQTFGFGGSVLTFETYINWFHNKKGYPYSLLYNWSYDTSKSNAVIAGEISQRVNTLLNTSRAAKVDIVTHSMGGLSSRYYIKNLGGASKVEDWVSLGGPNHGTTLARLCTTTACVEMRPGSTFLTALNAGDETPGSVRYATWYTAEGCDSTITPALSVVLAGATNTLVTPCVSHEKLHETESIFDQVWAFIK